MTPAQTAQMTQTSGYSSSSKGVPKQIQKVGQIHQVIKTVQVDLELNCTCEAKRIVILSSVLCSTSTLHKEQSFSWSNMISPRSGHGHLTVPIAVVMCGTQVELICDGQMNPWLTIFGWPEDAGKARYAALEKQERGHSKLHKDNDTIIFNVRHLVEQPVANYTHTFVVANMEIKEEMKK